MCLFFFYYYCHHRDLHSFPTRRSSDLQVVVRPASTRKERYVLSQSGPAWSGVPGDLRRAGGICAESTDRKSTRLNSSHITISYAVFCLKKKKRKMKSNNLMLMVSLTIL